jgi:hypothetical protein
MAGLQSAVNKAHQAAGASAAASAAHGGTVATTASPAAPAAPAGTAAPRSALAPRTAAAQASKPAPATSVTPAAGATRRLNIVERALTTNRVLALLFYNPTGADDRAVRQELASVPPSRGRVVSLAVPLAELSRYPVVTTQVPVTVSPTLVLIDPHQHASTIVGFSDRFEIAQRVSDALRVP